MINKSAIDTTALNYYRKLREAGFASYFVGGAVRDLLLGKMPKDFDIVTNATPHQIKKIIPQGRIIGKRFRHVMLDVESGRYEIITFRGPVVKPDETGKSEKEDLNQFGNAEQDALRRDFTINALFYDPDNDELIDYTGGKADVDQKILRSIGEPLDRLREDPIRILRAIRHKTKLQLEFDDKLKKAIPEIFPLLEDTSNDRIREELLKVCRDHSLGDFFQEIKNVGDFKYLVPWYNDLSTEEWQKAIAIWQKFRDSEEEYPIEVGLTLIALPILEKLILKPFLAAQTNTDPSAPKHPDMKFFLNCDEIKNFYLRKIHISRTQTENVLRALFYWNRMTGLWQEIGPPRKILGRLHQQISAQVAAHITILTNSISGHKTEDWILDLIKREKKTKEQKSKDSTDKNSRFTNQKRKNNKRDNSKNRKSGYNQSRIEDLPILDEPLVWNGPLHAPALRPMFDEEPSKQWTSGNQDVLFYRPSGIPLVPPDYSTLHAHLVENYKPELALDGTPLLTSSIDSAKESKFVPDDEDDIDIAKNLRREQELDAEE